MGIENITFLLLGYITLEAKYVLRWNHTYVNSLRIDENRRIPNIRNILRRSRINWRVIARTDFSIRYSPIFVFSENLEVPRIYSAHDDKYWEYTNTLIRTLLIRLFSPNVLGYSPRIYGCEVPPLEEYSNISHGKMHQYRMRRTIL